MSTLLYRLEGLWLSPVYWYKDTCSLFIYILLFIESIIIIIVIIVIKPNKNVSGRLGNTEIYIYYLKFDKPCNHNEKKSNKEEEEEE